MKKILTCMALCAFAAVQAFAAQPAKKAATPAVSTNTAWRAQVSKAATDPAALKATMATLQSDKAAQLAFIAAVNGAIASMPVSPEAQAAYFAKSAEAALGSVSKDNIPATVAEIYATVPVEQLPAVGDHLAQTGFNKNADPGKTYSDADFKKKAETVMDAVSKRLSGVENESARETLAIAMFGKASGGDSTALTSALADKYIASENDRKVAKDTWLPAAARGNYDALNGAAGVEEGTEPDLKHVVLGATGTADLGAALLASITDGSDTAGGVFATPLDTGFNDPQMEGLVDEGLWRVPAPAQGDDDDDGGFVPPGPYANAVP